jgi:hypothetical protein
MQYKRFVQEYTPALPTFEPKSTKYCVAHINRQLIPFWQDPDTTE